MWGKLNVGKAWGKRESLSGGGGGGDYTIFSRNLHFF